MVAGDSDSKQFFGAYGSEVMGLTPEELLVPLEAGQWPLIRIRHEQAAPASVATVFGSDRATIAFEDGGSARLDRASGSATLTTVDARDDGSLVHPLLATVGAVFAWWRGQVVFHGGAVVIGGGAWGLLGERGSGKSSLLAGLTVAGFDVLTDDVLVISEDRALAGPRCVDLRDESVRFLGLSTETRLVREGQRRRLHLGTVPPEVPLHGWILLSWGPAVSLEHVPLTGRVEGLAANLVGLHQTRFLELGTLPAWRLTRPSDWRSFQPAIERLVEAGTT
jgi:hypothetical protein